ncbi:MAG: hypothetical protein U0X20_01060 [Caldilineaceae bacterium]
MARTVNQSERVEGERSQAAVQTQPVVDRLYRLQPADLGGVNARPRRATVRFVGTQGIELPAPVLHFQGIAKPLVLDAVNVTSMAALAGSPLQRDWLGKDVVLGVVVEDNTPVVRLFAAGDPVVAGLQRKSVQAERARTRSLYFRKAMRAAVVFLVLIVAAYGVVLVINNWTTLIAAVLSFVNDLRS